MNKLLSFILLILTSFTATSHCMEQPFDHALRQSSGQAQDRPNQEQSAVPTLKQIASKKVAAELIKIENLKKFIVTPNYIQKLCLTDDLNSAVATQIMQNTTIPDSFTNLLLQKYILTDHTDDISSVTFSNDSRRLAIGDDDGTVCLYDTTGQQPQLIAQLLHHDTTDSPGLVALSNDDRWLATCCPNAVYLYDITGQEPQLIAQLQDHTNYLTSYLTSVEFSNDGRRLVTCCTNAVYLYDITGQEPQLIAPFLDHYHAAFSNDGRQLAAYTDHKNRQSDFDGTVCLYNITGQEPQLIAKFQDHADHEISAVAFSNDGRRLATGSYDGFVYLYDITGQQSQLIAQLHTHTNHIYPDHVNVNSVAFSNDCRQLATGCWNKIICLYKFEAFHEFEDFIERDLHLEHALLLHVCFKGKLSLQKHLHLQKYFLALPPAAQEHLVDQNHIKLMETKDLIGLAKSHWENQK